MAPGRDDHDRGLAYDLSTLLARRRVLGLVAGAGLASLVGCDSDATAGTTAACTEIPDETAGPYPADGSNGPDVLTQSGIVRRDIRKSFGSSTGTADGVPTTVTLTIQDAAKDCAARPGVAVYLWHCNRDGEYSLYSPGIENENYLRGVQETDDKGTVTFATIFPACYSGRWPHMHFEVYPTLADATTAGYKLTTSQLALPADVCETVYGTADGYGASRDNLTRVSLGTDNVFSDGYQSQLATVTGSVADGYRVALAVPV